MMAAGMISVPFSRAGGVLMMCPKRELSCPWDSSAWWSAF